MVYRMLMMMVLLAASAACSCSQRPTSTAAAIGPALRGEPTIRVRIRKAATALLLDADRRLTITTLGSSGHNAQLDPPAQITRVSDQWHVNGQSRPDLGQSAIEIGVADDQPITVGKAAYPQQIVLVPRGDQPNRFDVVNHVHLEAYLPGVLAKELYDDWQLTTYHAQAIAARSYAIYQILNVGRSRHYDVESTQASQAYVGLTDRDYAIAAVLDTTGLVLTYRDQIMPAYYHSTAGGAGASPTDAWGGDNPWLPLEPQPRRAWDVGSPHYRWGPIQRNVRTLRQRLAMWGAAGDRSIAQLGFIRSIKIDRVNGVGRPTRFAVTDHKGKTYKLTAEDFRVACNHSRPSRLKSDQRLKSSFVTIDIAGDTVTFRGHGFGHGVGMSQFGAEAMANAGRDVVEILETYYPGARIDRAY